MIEAWNIVVMLGGPSAEREVSLNSGAAVANALRSLGHRVTELDPKPCSWKLPDDTTVVFLALHGTYGEDGTVQAELNHMNVPYTGCSAEASRIAFDKVLTKNRCAASGVPVAKSLVVDSPKTPWPKKLAAARGHQAGAAGFERRVAICGAHRGMAGGTGDGAQV